ncbi:MAG: PucR family transcriptional regulator [Gulosibacter sp.]|uniref:PucR family transcriptional regulator n=1 Tax=Gulosibacter sp. TaxID=2817531 RepID=UPI003F93DB23
MVDDALTIGDLVATASLETELIAGEGGLWRGVLWAHSCELPRPWRWLGPNELLMTVGLCVPEQPDDQVEFVRSISNAGLAGIMLGRHDTCPAISEAMITEANRLDLPVLVTAPEIPFAAVSRHIAAASSTRQTMEVLTLAKLYSLAADSSENLDTFTAEVANLLRVGIRVTDTLTGLPLVDHAGPVSLAATEVRPYEYPLRASEPATLTIAEPVEEDLSSLVLVHLMKLLELNSNRVYARVRYSAERRSLLFEGLLRGSRDEAIESYLKDSSLADGYYVVAVAAEEFEKARRGLLLTRLPVLTTTRNEHGLVLVPKGSIAAVRECLRDLSVAGGASEVFSNPRDVSSAASQATGALTHRVGEEYWSEYRGVPVSVLARSVEEATEIVAKVLGELATDSPKLATLRDTLFTYLRCDRSWNAAAEELGIHRQTLAYRIKKIEAATGLSLTDTADIAALWIAYQSWQLVNGRSETG